MAVLTAVNVKVVSYSDVNGSDHDKIHDYLGVSFFL